ncbi:hypothetical protein [Plantactinospora sp. B5E13]|uniref:hypothetical protein n=1 Tax=unclassified Plantactinospora TaxID=2631981 RepID=UPI00325F3C4D
MAEAPDGWPGMYKVVLTEAVTVGDLNTWLNADLLLWFWPDLWLPPRLRERWKEAFPELAATRASAAKAWIPFTSPVLKIGKVIGAYLGPYP